MINYRNKLVVCLSSSKSLFTSMYKRMNRSDTLSYRFQRKHIANLTFEWLVILKPLDYRYWFALSALAIQRYH